MHAIVTSLRRDGVLSSDVWHYEHADKRVRPPGIKQSALTTIFSKQLMQNLSWRDVTSEVIYLQKRGHLYPQKSSETGCMRIAARTETSHHGFHKSPTQDCTSGLISH